MKTIHYLKNCVASGLSVVESLEKLKAELGIEYKIHDDGRILLDYSQVFSPKYNDIVRECRGLVLDIDFNLVARSFYRFYNLGENPDEVFDWDSIVAREKVDGSMINLHFHKGEWKITTRFSFCEHTIDDTDMTWRQLFDKATIGIDFNRLKKSTTYILELCSRYNKVVRDYKIPQVYLLTMFQGELEYDDYQVQHNGIFVCPDYIKVSNREEALEYLSKIEKEDPTYEGLVVRDKNNMRLKAKSLSYLTLHRIKGNCFRPKDALHQILIGEQEEILAYFPELKETIDKVSQTIEQIRGQVTSVWNKYKHLKLRKDFALAVVAETKYTAPLFNLYTKGGEVDDYLTEDYLEKFI